MTRALRRIRRLWSSGEQGQAVTETALLCFLLVCGAFGADTILRRQPMMLDAIHLYVRGFYLALSLPFP